MTGETNHTDRYLWLEVANARSEGAGKVEVQLKADRTDREPAWWPVRADAQGSNASETLKAIFQALDTKKVVLAGVGVGDQGLVICQIRIQFSDSGSR